MKQEEHLKLIRARCVELLEIASKRTPGEWFADNRSGCCATYQLCRKNESNGLNPRDDRIIHYSSRCAEYIQGPSGYHWEMDEQAQHDNSFIAACAGAAEAGWKATIAAIDGFTATCDTFVHPGDSIPAACAAIDSILAAWPLSLLQHQSP